MEQKVIFLFCIYLFTIESLISLCDITPDKREFLFWRTLDGSKTGCYVCSLKRFTLLRKVICDIISTSQMGIGLVYAMASRFPHQPKVRSGTLVALNDSLWENFSLHFEETKLCTVSRCAGLRTDVWVPQPFPSIPLHGLCIVIFALTLK